MQMVHGQPSAKSLLLPEMLQRLMTKDSREALRERSSCRTGVAKTGLP